MAALATLPLDNKSGGCGVGEISLESVVSVLGQVSRASRLTPREPDPVSWHLLEIKIVLVSPWRW